MGLLMGKFRQCLTELSACDTIKIIMAGYYSLTFLFFCMINLMTYTDVIWMNLIDEQLLL